MKIFVTTFCILTIAIFSGCRAGIKEYRNFQEPIEVKSGNNFIIALESNRTTGYEWQLAKPLDAATVELIGSQYLAPDTKRIGTAGKEHWTFKGVGRGKTPIFFKYVRPWEKNIAPAKELTFKIIVH